MADGAEARVRVVRELAADLAALRDSVGTPSFRELAGRSHAISHTTLHAAAQGLRLPSWPTTVEFVRACGADPADYRARWEAAERVVNAPPDPSGLPEPEPAREAEPPESVRRPPTVTRVAVVAVVLAVVAGITGVVVAWGDEPAPTAAAERTPTQCPVRPTNPAPAPPAHPGDDAAFLADITLPDCTVVPPGVEVTKIWRLKNVGTVAWVGYSLRRDQDQARQDCQTIADVPVPDTAPGEVVDIEVQVLTPDQAELCVAMFKLVDASGVTAFPGRRTVNFQLVVDPSAPAVVPATATPTTGG